MDNKTLQPTYFYAGFWIRLVASIVDDIFIIMAGGFLSYVINFILYFSTYGLHPFSSSFERFGLFPVIIVISWLYNSLLMSSNWQATFGMRAVGIMVIDEDTGKKIPFAQATMRYFSSYISYFIFCIGYIMIAFSRRRQALHDKIAGTYVVYKNPARFP